MIRSHLPCDNTRCMVRMTDATYQLCDGRELQYDGPLARWERELIAKHMGDLRRLDSTARRLYLDDVGRSMGEAYRQKLAETYAQDWAERKAQQEKSK